MLASIFVLTILTIGVSQNEAALEISHPYEVLNFDRSVLTELRLHRQRRSVYAQDEQFQVEIERRLKRDLDREKFYLHDDHDRNAPNPLHMYSKLPANEFDNSLKANKLNDDKLGGSDDDLFRKRKLRSQIKNDALNEKTANRKFNLNFNAHNRQFKLVLKGKQHNDVFSPDVEFESTKRGRFNYDTDNIINGFIEGEKGSYIEGVITHDGLIDGLIRTKDEEFYIEPARNYLQHGELKQKRPDEKYRNQTNDEGDFHSIIYKLSDLNFPNVTCKHHHYEHNYENLKEKLAKSSKDDVAGHQRNKRQIDELNLKLKNDTSIKAMPFSNSSIGPDQLNDKYLEVVRKHSLAAKKPAKPANTNRKYYWNKPYWKEIDALHYNSEAYGVRAISRTHWTSDIDLQNHLVVDSKKSTCMLYLQADHLFYNRMGSEEATVETMIRHVQKVNSIYRVTDFDQDGRADNISFLIKRIKVHTTDALKDNEYRFPANYGVERFLELFSEEDYDQFCLAYMFTYRDFEGGTLGLAWTGDLKNAGGVCEKNGHYRGSLKSLNTGIITLLNYGKHVPPIVSHITLAHEIGHNFGSAHDPEEDQNCTPGGENGNFIMFARATSGDKKNNNKFSPCSLKSVNAVLNTKARSLKGCFQEPQEAICGNEVVEPGEECDCGWEEDCVEPCCFPMKSNPNSNETPCKLRPGFVCSPSQGPCCTHDTCRLKVGNKCRDDNGCRTASYCSGQTPQCPPSVNKPNKTICNEESVCYMGECTGSICIAFGLESCQCKRKEGASNKRNVDPLCELCCRLPGDDSSCKSSFEWNSPPYDVPDLLAKPGSPCDAYRGYCDANQICREVNPTGLGFIKYLLSDQSISLIRNWVQHQYWLAGLLCCIAFVLCALLLKALRKAHQREACKSNASNLLSAVPGILGGNPISSGFTLFGHSPVANPTAPSTPGLQATSETNSSAYTNPYSSTYAVTNANYSNAYGYAGMTGGQQQQSSLQQSTYADYGLTNPITSSSCVTTTSTSDQTGIDSIYGSSGLTKSSNQTAAYPNNQSNPTYTTATSTVMAPENEVKSLSSNYNGTSINLNNTTQYGLSSANLGSNLPSNLSSNLSSNLTNNLSSNLSTRPPPYSQFQSNYSSYGSNNLVSRQNRLSGNGSNVKSLSSAISNPTSSSTSFKTNSNGSSNSSSSRSTGLNKSYSKNSSSNLTNLNSLAAFNSTVNQSTGYTTNSQAAYGSAAGPSYSSSSNNPTNYSSSSQMQPANYLSYQTQYFQQQQPLHRTNNSASASEYGHTPMHNHNQWV